MCLNAFDHKADTGTVITDYCILPSGFSAPHNEEIRLYLVMLNTCKVVLKGTVTVLHERFAR